MKPLYTIATLFAAAAMTAVPVRGAAAPADTPAAYSHVIPVTVSGKQAVVQLRLPRAVYLEARSDDLRDLRLFDAAGSAMPFALVERVRDPVRRTSAPVSVFPLRAPAGTDGQEGLQIRTRTDGTLVSVRPAGREAGEVLASLVLDLRQPGRPDDASVAVGAIVPVLAPAAGSYSARVRLEASDDLQHWTPLADAAISWLVNAEGARVQKNRIEFAPRAFRYARVTWLEGKPLEFAAVQAEYLTEVGAADTRDGIVLPGTFAPGGEDVLYTAPPAIPVEAVGLVFHGQNVVVPAVLGQYRQRGVDRPAELVPVASTTFYQLTQDGQLRSSGDVEVAPTHASQWVLRPQTKLAAPPALRLRWQPDTIVFVAGGKGPYTLAFGRDGARPARLPLAQITPGFTPRELAGLEAAQAGAPVRQHDPGARPDGAAPARTVWLWALLLCGVAALGFMAWRLARQLKEAPPADG